MIMYKLYKTELGTEGATLTNEDGSTASFLFNPDNTDYQAYLKWLAEGNEPEPAEGAE
jgi:hypothetical protein